VAYSRNSATPATASGGSVTTTGISTTGGANTVFILFVQSRAAGNTPTDSKGNTYTALRAEATVTLGGVNYFCRVWKCVAGTGGASHTFTATNGGSTFITIHAHELLGVTDVDVDNAWNADTTANYTSNTLSPTQASVVVFGVSIIFSTSAGSTWTHSGDGFTTVSSAFTNGVAGPCGEMREQTGDNAHSYQTTITTTNPASDVGMYLFAVTVASSSTTVKGLAALGVG
jgi:hypothetical protein